MTIIESILSADSLAAVGAIALAWLLSKVVDKLLEVAIQKQLFAPIYRWFWRKGKSILSWKKPISTEFQLSYNPIESVDLDDARDIVENALLSCEEESKDKISIEEIHWRSTYKGRARVEYIDGHYPYDVFITLAPDTDAIRDSHDGEVQLVNSINFTVEFQYPFYRLEDALFNVDSFISFLEKGLEQTIDGSFSGGRFVISPVKSDLSLDEWIEQEQFEPSLLLTSENEAAEVEFFHDRAVVSTPYREVDSETVGYIRAVLLNYYLDS